MTSTDPTYVWVVIGAIATAASAVFAGGQIYLSRRDANNRAALDFLREIDLRVQDAWQTPTSVAEKEILAYYRRERTDLTPSARSYFALLNSLELLAYAIEKDLVDRKTVDDFVKTIVNDDVLSLAFLRDLQACCKNTGVYEHLYSYVVTLVPDLQKDKSVESVQ